MARRFQQNRLQRRRSNKGWSGIVQTGFTTLAANTSVVVGSLVLSNAGIDETVLRTVGQLTIGSDQTAATEEQIGAMGMIVITDVALAAGIASIPNPFTNTNDDGWYLYVPIGQRVGLVTAPAYQTYAYDSRAKRKIEDGYSVAIVLANSSTTNGLTFHLVMRTLTMVS